MATFLKGVGMGVSDGAQAARAGLAELADVSEEVWPSAMRKKSRTSRPFGRSGCGHSQHVGPWSSERPQTWQPPALSEWSEGP